MSKKKGLFLPLFLCVLLVYTAYVLLDTFVIVRRISAAAEVINTSDYSLPVVSADTAESTTPVLTENSYTGNGISISISEERIGDTTVYVADVQLSSADSLKTAFAENSYGRNITDTTSSIAESVNAVLAINGDYYGVQQSGYVIRNGVLYRSKAKKGAEDLVIYRDGSFAIIQESEITAQELMENGAWNVLSFGPALIEDGEISVSVNDEVGRAKADNPRTAIAVIDGLHYLFVVSDGRTSESQGLSLYELASYLQTKGAQTAYNLDGGGSSTMVFNGEVVNNPTSGGERIKERSVSDIVYIG
ncbi:MAG: phosphodiester glycosidase family protein [Clostridia bacterium]|nr:phosphodiester glycosidase family protein [Clostridia bacterium]